MCQRLLNLLYLLCDDGQDLDIDAIELVEAGPGASTGETLEELAHGHEVELIAAVEDHALDGHGLGQVLGGLGFAGAGGTGRRAAELEMESARERQIASVRERRDDQATRVAQVLVAVEELGVDRPDVQVLADPVVAQLADPLEVVHVAHLLLEQIDDDVARVHLDHDESRKRLTRLGAQLAAHQAAQVVELLQLLGVVLGQLLGLESGAHLLCPECLTAGDDHLARPLDHPFCARFL